MVQILVQHRDGYASSLHMYWHSIPLLGSKEHAMPLMANTADYLRLKGLGEQDSSGPPPR